MFKPGEFVRDHITGEDGNRVAEEQVQPNGVELTVDKIWSIKGITGLGDESYEKAEREEAKTVGPGHYVDKSSSRHHGSINLVRKTDTSPDVENERDTDLTEFDLDEEHYLLTEGPYVVRYNEKIEIPDGFIGVVFPRSRVIRSGNHLTTALWDTGYEGRGEGGLHINTVTAIQEDMRIGQMCLVRADSLNSYDGSHQGENIDE